MKDFKGMEKDELVKMLEALFCEDATHITSAESVAAVFRGMIVQPRQEHFFIMLLDGAHNVIKTELIFIGTLNQSLVHPREVFARAVELRVAGIIIGHNHPSNTLRASEEDKIVTERLKLSADILGIDLIDHVIITDSSHWSFKGNKLL